MSPVLSTVKEKGRNWIITKDGIDECCFLLLTPSFSPLIFNVSEQNLPDMNIFVGSRTVRGFGVTFTVWPLQCFSEPKRGLIET